IPSKWRLPAAAFSKTKVEVRKIGGFKEPSDKAGSKPWPIIIVDGFSLRPPISSTEVFGRRRGVAPLRSDSSVMYSLLAPIGSLLSWDRAARRDWLTGRSERMARRGEVCRPGGP